ncbi:hypothetical protein A2U01_0113139, partial [Trifolium medium]|nr:hypothetical protein [Trifolium medium]
EDAIARSNEVNIMAPRKLELDEVSSGDVGGGEDGVE